MEKLSIQHDTDFLASVILYNRQKFIAFNEGIPFTIDKQYERFLNSRYQKVNRIKKRLLYLLIRYKYIWFCTFTINPTMYKKSERTRRNYLKEYLYSHDFKIILNTDYGQNGTERLHYHVILATNIDMDVNQYFQSYLSDTFGWNKSLPCIRSDSDLVRLSKYIDKLSNHCVKASTKNGRMLYNFKGYDSFCPTSSDSTHQYHIEYNYFKNVSLLDKADTTGKNFLSS